MKVILLSDLRHRGKRGETVEVKPGFARNYLLPQGLALVANTGNQKYFEQQRAKIDARHLHEKTAAQTVADRLQGVVLTIPKRVGETDTLYGSVTAGDIADVLAKQGVEVDRRRIDLEGGIKTLGEHEIRVRLHSDVVAAVKVTVVAETS